MKRSRRKIEELTWVFGLHRTAISIHRMIGRREDASGLSDFFSQILPPDALVFDIGANVGIYSDALEGAGAKVVAVEPNSDCVRHMELTFRGRRIETVHAAVGPCGGVVTLYVSDARDDWSTVCNDTPAFNAGLGTACNRPVTVPVVTLDSLISHFGMPAFIKIDVEGYESSVLDGLSRQPPLLSFEVNYLYAERAITCLDKPVFANNSLFNVKSEGIMGFELPRWVGRDEIRGIVTKILNDKMYKDIFVRK